MQIDKTFMLDSQFTSTYTDNFNMMQSNKQSGFSLIELLIVIAILGLIAGLVGPQMMQYFQGAKSDTAKLQIEDFGSSLDLFYLANGRYPVSQEGLSALISQPHGLEKWNGPYLKKKVIPVDPWGNEYHYASPGEHGAYDLYSFGADNAPGGTDDYADIVSWE